MARIVIIGLGPGKPGQLTLEARQTLLRGQPLFFRTGRHPVAADLAHKGVKFHTFDYLYNRAPGFEHLYKVVARRVVRAAIKHGVVYYAVPGHPAVGEATVQRLIREARREKIKVKVIPGVSFLEPALSALGIDLLDGVSVIDALDLANLTEPHRMHLLLAQVHSRAVASRVKLKLLELYPHDFVVTVLNRAGMHGEKVDRLPLYTLDRREFDHYSAVYLPPAGNCGLSGLVDIIAKLRRPDGCPWDKRQSHHSLRQYMIEEAYEVIAAIEEEDDASLQEELGDLLLQVVLHSQIAREEGRFNLNHVIESIAKKMIHRHPHVFGENKADSVSQAVVSWEQVKKREKGLSPGENYWPGDGLPALLASFKIQKRAADLGFDWPDIQGAVDKLQEESQELRDAYQQGVSGKIEEEFGDFLFAAVNVARFLKINPEMALGKAARKFISRFQYVLAQVEHSGRLVTEYSLAELDLWWEEAKITEAKIANKQESQ